MSKRAKKRTDATAQGPRPAGVRDAMTPHDRLVRRTPELKHLDTNSGGYVAGVTYAGTVTDLTAVVQGGAANQRVGDALRIRGLDFRFAAYHQVGSVQGVLRFVVFAWNEDSSPTMALLMQGTGAATVAVAPYNKDHMLNGSMNILYDSQYVGDSSPDAFYFKRQDVVDLQVAYAAGSTSGAGKVWLAVFSDAGLATNCANYQWWMRLSYTDL